MNRLKEILIAIMLLIQSIIFFSFASQNLYFEHLKVSHGLSHYSVNSLYQDENGMVWIGTRDGLNRYDGNSITVYKQEKDNPNALFGNNIRSVCGDKNGFLFMQCKSGLVSLDLRTEIFTTIRRQDVTYISYGKEHLWYSVNDSIFSYNPRSKQEVHFYLSLPQKSRITSLLETTDRHFYVATKSEGLLVFDRNKKNIRNWKINDIISLYEDSKKNIWACTRYDGLYKIDYSGNVVSYKHDPKNPESIPDNFVRTICEDDFGNYWIGLYTGLCRLNPEKEQFSFYKYERQVDHGISNSSVWSIINDSQGTIWVGTYFGGIDLINPKYSIYDYYGAYSNNPKSLSSPVVGRIIEEQSGNLWIGTDGGGVNYYDRLSQTFTSYMASDKPNTLSANTIKSLWLDEKRGNLWIGTHLGGLNKMNLSTKEFTVFQHDPTNPNSIPNNNVRKIVSKNDTLYLSTENSIGAFDLKSETCKTINFKNVELNKRELPDLIIDSKERTWFSCSNNVYKWNRSSNELVHFDLNNNVLVFFEDSENQILAGTDGDGIYLYNEIKNLFEPYVEFNKHLISKYIIDIRESNGGYYYVSTNAGLVIVGNELKNSQLLNRTIGFPLESLNENSILITGKNEVFVGGVNGMVSFLEKNLNMPKSDYAVNITGIRVNNEKLSPAKNSILKQALPYLNEITLKPHHSVFTVQFSTTNYIDVLKTDVQYQLVGFDNNWVDANYQQSITYTNLNPGTYILKLRGKNPIGIGSYPSKDLKITVLPPFYKTTLAYIFYVLLFLGLSFILIRFYTSKIKLSAALEYEKREKAHTEELNQSKLRFFTNISHEFRTPLTLIMSQLEAVQKMANVPQSIYNRLLNVMKNANRMKNLITELIDFRKYEQGFMDVKVSENNFINFLDEIFISFKEMAHTKEIEYTFEYKQSEIKLWFDKNQMEKAFYNLLANAFKYTPNKGKINLKVEEEGLNINAYVIDSGIGIEKDALNQIFNRFYQVEDNSIDEINTKGSGIGLALAKAIVNLHGGEIMVDSEPGIGTKFQVKLKMGNTHFKTEQIITTKSKNEEVLTEVYLPEKEFIDEIITSQKAADAQNSSILIIEDNEELLQLLAEIFEPIYKVYTAIDGIDGFEKACKHQPDIIVSDIMMPRMSGIEMCSKLKTNFDTSHIPVILLTAKTAADFMVQGLLTGADDYVVKPFNTKVLVTRCNNLINSRKALQQRYATQVDSEPQLIATNSIDQKLVEKATQIIEENIDNPDFDVNTFATEIGLSRTNLFNKLKGVTGQTPNDFIINLRLKKSIFYLTNSPEKSISDIAALVGFGSTSYYIKKFRQPYGVTPSQYRKLKS